MAEPEGKRQKLDEMQQQHRVIIVGGGLAGLSAAIEAFNSGVNVVLIDKMKSFGGNSAKATSGINGAHTKYQIEAKIEDSVEEFEKDTVSSGQGLSKPELVKLLVESSNNAVEWLSSFKLTLSAISQCGGHSKPRTHREPPLADGKPAPIGWDIIKTLTAHIKTFPSERFESIFEARATKFLVEGDRVVGIEYENAKGEKTELKANAVVMATGGYCCDRSEDSLLIKYAPKKAKLATTNGAFAVGDGIRMGTAIGAKLIHMDKVQVHPTGFVDPQDRNNPVKFLGPEALRGCGGIMLNNEGKRFVDELGRRDHVSEAIFSLYKDKPNELATAYLIMNDEAVEHFGKAAWTFYHTVKKFGVTVKGTQELAAHIHADPEVVLKTFQDYQAATSGKEKDVFGKTVFPVKFDPNETLHVVIITPCLHYSMGGMEINVNAEILKEIDSKLEPIKGLYGAGEVTGGLHGENRLAGNSLLECVVFGRVAGKNAAHFSKL